MSNPKIMRHMLTLVESTGGIARRWIEVQTGKDVPFVDANSKEVYHMQDLRILPADPALRYEDQDKVKGSELLDRDIQTVIDSLHPLDSRILGNKTGRAAMIVAMVNDQGESLVIVKKFPAKRSQGPNGLFWQTTNFAKETGLWAQTAQLKKAALPIEPTDFVSEGQQYSINQLPGMVANQLKNSNLPQSIKQGLPQLLSNVQTKSIKPVPGLAEYQSTIEIKLSEIAVPLALQTGNFMTGDYETANRELLRPMGTSWQQATAVSFPAKAEKLIDATIWFGDDKIDVSVKDSSGGARPSTATIADILNTADFTKSFRKKNAQYIEAIQLLNEMSAIQAPLALAVKYGALSQSDADWLTSFYGQSTAESAMTQGWIRLLDAVSYNPDKTHPEYQLGYHLLAVAAKWVSEYLNKDSAEITDFFKTVLNQSSLVQVYGKTKTGGQDGLYFSQFRCVWPPVFQGTIHVDANSYTARTRPSRKISFSFGSARQNASQDQTASSTDQAAARERLDQVTAEPRLTGPGARASRAQQQPRMTADVLGREKRRR